ncbi:hypothetical protein Bca52824_037820 [Brassica carinata]|uniref:Uncharacterized protein n=1 Tax=Brassica carinata TaxID=52824 RepID=A0A8X7UVF0_BRACI|nr:hypothetical protein Bca52824_037820 [Brassica carinata]
MKGLQQRQVREQVRSAAERDYDSFSVKPFNGNYDEELGVFINSFVTDEGTSQEQLLFSFLCLVSGLIRRRESVRFRECKEDGCRACFHKVRSSSNKCLWSLVLTYITR